MSVERLTQLFGRFLDKTISPVEKQELSELALLEENQPELRNLLQSVWDRNTNYADMPENTAKQILSQILPTRKSKPILRLWWVRRIAVAAVLTGIIFGTYLFIHHLKVEKYELSSEKLDLKPGKNTAVLTLGNGTKIILDSISNGTLVMQGNTQIIKTDSGKLNYLVSAKKETEIKINTLTTPRGGQYQLVLPDGTKVWLNAASSITYPTAFIGKERKVEISGEAYFEVVHNAKMPFIVKTGDQSIEDIGTEFNINAYPDEPAVTTTLISGSVKISARNQNNILVPGQQETVTNNSIRIQDGVDLDKVIAWKQGLFVFNQTLLPVIMRQLSRWYDIDIKYEGTVSTETFGGGISRDLPLSDVLKLLKANGVEFRLDQKQLIVKYQTVK